MKKCASCTKDLPDAALHCVFCGAKQPPAPAVAGGQAKTVMGYSANEVAEHLKQQGHAPRSAPPFAPPRAAPSPSAGGQFPPPNQSYPSAPPQYQPPSAAANAKTMFVPGAGPGGPGPAPGPAFPPGPGPGATGPTAGAFAVGGGPAPAHQPQLQPQPPQPYARPSRPSHPAPMSQPSALPQYQATHSIPERAGRPIEPWKDALRIMMFVWGGVLVLAFLTPTSLVPELKFHFNTIIDGAGLAKLDPLVLAAVGLLSIVLAAIPMSSVPRGLMAGLMGLTGLLLPMIMDLVNGADFQWQPTVGLVGMVLLIPGLFLRHEYREALLPRLLITFGALAVLAPELVPNNGAMPLVAHFEAVIDAEGDRKVVHIVAIVQLLLVVATLLAWLPSPSTGGAKLFAWLLILWGVVDTLVMLVLALGDGNLGAGLELSPYGALMAWAPLAGYLVLVGYGFASVLGKQLE